MCNMKRIKVKTDDNIILKGFLFNDTNNSNECCLFIPGFEGNFVSNDFVDELIETFKLENIDFLYAHTRGSFQISNSVKTSPEDRNKIIGTAFEKIEDAVYDLKRWFEYLETLNYKIINVITHSFGGVKLIYFLNNCNYKPKLNKIVLLSPMDLVNRTKKRKKYFAIREEAMNNIQQGFPERLIKCGFYYQSSKTFIDMMDDKTVNCWPILNTENSNLEYLNNIKQNIVIIYGQEETDFISSIPNFQKVIPSNYKFISLPNANHSYEGVEKELSAVLVNILKDE